MGKITRKSTRLFYKDEKSIEFWSKLPAELCQKMLLACLEYEYGGGIPTRLNDDPVAQALFIQLKEKIDYNEFKWYNDGRSKTSADNGRKHTKHEVVNQETGEVFESFNPQYSNDTGITTGQPDRKLH